MSSSSSAADPVTGTITLGQKIEILEAKQALIEELLGEDDIAKRIAVASSSAFPYIKRICTDEKLEKEREDIKQKEALLLQREQAPHQANSIFDALNGVQATLALLVRTASSSFHSTPVYYTPPGEVSERQSMNRPRGALGRTRGTLPSTVKPRQYAEEWAANIAGHRENSGFSVHQEGNWFKLKYQEQHNATIVEKYQCPNTHVAIKSAFFALGLNGYNCNKFLEFAGEYGVAQVQTLSADGTPASCYAQPDSSSSSIIAPMVYDDSDTHPES